MFYQPTLIINIIRISFKMFYNDIHSVGYKSAKQAFYGIPLKRHSGWGVVEAFSNRRGKIKSGGFCFGPDSAEWWCVFKKWYLGSGTR